MAEENDPSLNSQLQLHTVRNMRAIHARVMRVLQESRELSQLALT